MLTHLTESIRLAGKIVDMPCNEMHTDAFVEEAKRVAVETKSKMCLIRGTELKDQGFGGLWNVGKAATRPPALVVLSHQPEGAKTTISWVGKGIVYDTGGLSIKGKATMPGMKRDCGGAAAILGAYRTAVQMGFKETLHCVLCLAENAVGPESMRPDDIITLYSGKTVEVNNTDAEGRLVLGDGVAYASKDLKSDIIVDLATLTGTQSITTGKYHGAILSNIEQWETHCLHSGKASGDHTYPIIYCPEFQFTEFASHVADMKNSVNDRMNAQTSCAGIFIQSHLEDGFDFSGVALHVDMAGPAASGERATSWGVSFLLTLFGQYSGNASIRAIAPEISTDEIPTKKRRLDQIYNPITQTQHVLVPNSGALQLPEN